MSLGKTCASTSVCTCRAGYILGISLTLLLSEDKFTSSLFPRILRLGIKFLLNFMFERKVFE